MAREGRRAEEVQTAISCSFRGMVQGIIVICGMAALASWLGGRFPLLGPAVTGMILGIVLRNVLKVGAQFGQVTTFCVKSVLKVAVVFLGSTFTIQQAVSLGKEYLPVILSTIVITLGSAYLAGQFLGVPRALANLIGSGTAICGVTAILTIGPVVRAKDQEIMYAVTTIFLFNLIAMILYPLVGHLTAMKQGVFGAWVGTAIHDTSSVLAAAFGYGDEAGRVATVVKLTRTVFLVPLVAWFSLTSMRWDEGKRSEVPAAAKGFPVFILGFLGMSVLSSLGLISLSVGALLGKAGKFLIVVVLVAVGLSSDLGKLRMLGLRPLVIGLVTSGVVALTSLSLLTTVVGTC